MSNSSKTRELRFYICLSIISIIILMWLISPLFYPDVWKGYFQQEDPDSLLFTRQLEQSLLKGRVLTTDNYAAFPYETKTGFAPTIPIDSDVATKVNAVEITSSPSPISSALSAK